MSWLTTYTKKHIYLSNISESSICLEDIAQGLSNECRYAGQIQQFYSVAEHSVLVSKLVEPEFALEALLHDATEAYLKDLPSPLKAILPEYQKLERQLYVVIADKFGIPHETSAAVKQADLALLATERQQLEIAGDEYWPCLNGVNPVEWLVIIPFTPIQARYRFLARFHELTNFSHMRLYGTE
ncbi:HD family hydrolase [Xenorhabdus bovienii]|uniref:HD family hydrolase n=1 Tax=Xenorhabdus bovienii TaxID=40576 RepID=UPI001EDE8113|nr:HD family hydrolase [Xenorhabdus bovienii]MCG3463088.1 HD family hydrolase [Xenorhabdus bovienii]